MGYAKVHKPSWIRQHFPQTDGLYMGCPQDGAKLAYGAKAHRHDEPGHPLHNAICFNAEHADGWDEDYPTVEFLHEYAHILEPRQKSQPSKRTGRVRWLVHHADWKAAFQALLDTWHPGTVATRT